MPHARLGAVHALAAAQRHLPHVGLDRHGFAQHADMGSGSMLLQKAVRESCKHCKLPALPVSVLPAALPAVQGSGFVAVLLVQVGKDRDAQEFLSRLDKHPVVSHREGWAGGELQHGSRLYVSLAHKCPLYLPHTAIRGGCLTRQDKRHFASSAVGLQ